MKKNMKYTKEPWHILGEDMDVGEIPFIAIWAGDLGTSSSRPICDVSSSLLNDDYILTAEDWDTAYLINAAPALVEALELLVAADNCNYTRDSIQYEGLFNKARIALKLAKGE